MSKPGFPVSARRTTALVSVAALLTFAAACSSSKSATPSSSSTGSPPSTSAPSSPAAGTTVSTGMAKVSGTQTTVLTAPDGHTLYYFTPDTAGGQPTCTASCAALWPPLVSANPTASGATGKLTVATGANGSQVIYNGHPLYEYKPDTAAGQASGEGVMGKWHAATPGLAAGAATTPAPSSPSTSGGGSGSGGY